MFSFGKYLIHDLFLNIYNTHMPKCTILIVPFVQKLCRCKKGMAIRRILQRGGVSTECVSYQWGYSVAELQNYGFPPPFPPNPITIFSFWNSARSRFYAPVSQLPINIRWQYRQRPIHQLRLFHHLNGMY